MFAVFWVGRICKLERSALVLKLEKNIRRFYKDEEILHREPIEKIADEVIFILQN